MVNVDDDDNAKCTRLSGLFSETIIGISIISVLIEIIFKGLVESRVVEDTLPGVPNKVSITTSSAYFC